MNSRDLLSKIYKKRTSIDYILYSSIIVLGIILDQLTKYLAATFMDIGQTVPLIKNFLHITYTTNDGAAFGMLDGEIGRVTFMVVSTIMIITMSLYLFLGHAENLLYAVAVSMIVSGGIGNMIDRLGLGFYTNGHGVGEVIDFIYFRGVWNYIFNGAGSFVCIGAGLLILALIIDMKSEIDKKKLGDEE